MRYLSEEEVRDVNNYLERAAELATKSLCLKRKCGAVIVANGRIIGEGYNAPPKDNLAHRRCLMKTKFSIKPHYNRTCCVHAEERAISDALRKNSSELSGSCLYFMSVGDDNIKKFAGEPLCTGCSRASLDVGISEFVLWCEDGIRVYPTDEYDEISYKNINA